MTSSASLGDLGTALLELYPRALPEVYGYLLSRCGDASLAEDLTSETFMAAVAAVRKGATEAVASRTHAMNRRISASRKRVSPLTS
jgi:RNA polymerase sigma-70 factor (ECF subfamily)